MKLSQEPKWNPLSSMARWIHHFYAIYFNVVKNTCPDYHLATKPVGPHSKKLDWVSTQFNETRDIYIDNILHRNIQKIPSWIAPRLGYPYQPHSTSVSSCNPWDGPQHWYLLLTEDKVAAERSTTCFCVNLFLSPHLPFLVSKGTKKKLNIADYQLNQRSILPLLRALPSQVQCGWKVHWGCWKARC